MSRRYQCVALLSVCTVLVLWTGHLEARVYDSGRAGIQKVFLQGTDSATQLAAELQGQGVEGIPSATVTDGSGGTVVWRIIRDESDNVGMRHVFYRQYYIPPSWISAGLDPKYATNGVEVSGSEIGLHFAKDGTLSAVFGTQAPAVIIANSPAIMSVADAYDQAQEAVETQPGFAPGNHAMWSRDLVRRQIALSHLLLWKDSKDTAWRYAWEVPTISSAGMTFRVIMDAATGEVLHLRQMMVADSCTPTSSSGETAVAQPQNPSIPQRYVWATVGSAVGTPFTDDAHKVSSYGHPEEILYHGTQYHYCGAQSVRYEVLPLTRDDFNRPFYAGASGSTYPGSVAGDAMYFTYQTMSTFQSLGRNGWDRFGSPAPVVVDGVYGIYLDQAFFNPDPYYGAPENSVVVLPNGSNGYSLAAAIDAIAHEWGHGVIRTSANWPYEGEGNGGQMQEGWADVIGYITEFDHQPAGSGPEKADWKGGEDSYTSNNWLRRVDLDDGPGNYTFHRLDDIGSNEAHNRGNMLPVAFRLLDVGGLNPICSRPGWTTDCDVSITGQGLTKAKKIFFRMLTYYCTSTTEWGDLADLGKLAAYDLYCDGLHPFSSCAQQRATEYAFRAIGYPPADLSCYQCPTLP